MAINPHSVPLTFSKYRISYQGSSGVRPIEFEREERTSTAAIQYIERDLPHYWPAYYVAYLFSEDGNHLATCNAKVTVTSKGA